MMTSPIQESSTERQMIQDNLTHNLWRCLSCSNLYPHRDGTELIENVNQEGDLTTSCTESCTWASAAFLQCVHVELAPAYVSPATVQALHRVKEELTRCVSYQMVMKLDKKERDGCGNITSFRALNWLPQASEARGLLLRTRVVAAAGALEAMVWGAV